MFKKFFLSLLTLTLLIGGPLSFAGASSIAGASLSPEKHRDQTSTFTLYLMRHAEKESQQADPSLTIEGLARATAVANFLANKSIHSVYTTPYLRTQQTAEPLSRKLKKDSIEYNPRLLESFAQKLLTNQESALIVGHSNTTPQLARLLGAEEIPDMNESTFNWLIELTVNDGVVKWRVIDTDNLLVTDGQTDNPPLLQDKH